MVLGTSKQFLLLEMLLISLCGFDMGNSLLVSVHGLFIALRAIYFVLRSTSIKFVSSGCNSNHTGMLPELKVCYLTYCS